MGSAAAEEIKTGQDSARGTQHIRRAESGAVSGEVIGKIARNFWYAEQDAPVDIVADELGRLGQRPPEQAQEGHPAMLFMIGQAQQGANLDGAEVIKRVPDSAAFPLFVAGGSAAPSVEQVEAGFVGEMVFNGHGHVHPFLTGQIRWDVAQGRSDGVRGVLGVVVVHD